MKDQNIKSETSNKKKGNFLTKFLIIIALSAITAIVVMWFYHKHEIKTLQESNNKEQILIQEKTIEILKERDRMALELLMKPFVWAIRAEMLRDNMEQVNQYAYQLVKEKDFELVLIVSKDGQVISSTDKKLEGSSFSDQYDGNYLNVEEITVAYPDSSQMYITAPILGYNDRLATLFIEYSNSTDLDFMLKEMSVE